MITDKLTGKQKELYLQHPIFQVCMKVIESNGYTHESYIAVIEQLCRDSEDLKIKIFELVETKLRMEQK